MRAQIKYAEDILEESKMAPHTPEKELLSILAKLLEPNPDKRMRINEFLGALKLVKESFELNKP